MTTQIEQQVPIGLTLTAPPPNAGLHDLVVVPPAAGLETKLAVFGPAIPPQGPVWIPIPQHPLDHHLYIVKGEGKIQDTGLQGNGPNGLEITIRTGDAVYLERDHQHRIMNTGGDLIVLSAKAM